MSHSLLCFAVICESRSRHQGDGWDRSVVMADEGEMAQSLDQREDVSDQMVEMMSGRLSYLQKLMVERKNGMAGDVDPNSTFGSHLVPKMKPAFDEDLGDEHHSKHRRKKAMQLNTHPPPSEGGLTVTLSRAALLERMSLPADGDGRLGAKSKHVQNEKQEKVESKRAAKSEIERELQANLESFVTRSVESVVYTIGQPPIGMGHTDKQPRLLLSHTLQRIVMPNGERMFKHYCLNILDRKVYCEAFWYIHCVHFQPGSQAEQAYLLEKEHVDSGIPHHHGEEPHAKRALLEAERGEAVMVRRLLRGSDKRVEALLLLLP